MLNYQRVATTQVTYQPWPSFFVHQGHRFPHRLPNQGPFDGGHDINRVLVRLHGDDFLSPFQRSKVEKPILNVLKKSRIFLFYRNFTVIFRHSYIYIYLYSRPGYTFWKWGNPKSGLSGLSSFFPSTINMVYPIFAHTHLKAVTSQNWF